MLTLIALAIVIVGLVAIKASARLVAIIITITAVVVLGSANAHAAPGLGACGECTSNIIGLSIDYLIAIIFLITSVVGTIVLVRNDKKNK